VVTRRQKLFAAGLVLLAGFALAWPLRRAEPLLPARTGVTSVAATQTAFKPVAIDQPFSPQAAVVASVVATRDNLPSVDPDPFAAAPALTANGAAKPQAMPVVALQAAEPEARIHVVHQGDSLDRLAKRYLDDEGRALEIFDLNRDVLENPHLLPIGAELRIPAKTESESSASRLP
jgi:nucleoid-associated protein YgaU